MPPPADGGGSGRAAPRGGGHAAADAARPTAQLAEALLAGLQVLKQELQERRAQLRSCTTRCRWALLNARPRAQVLSILDATAATWPNVTQAVLDLDYLASAASTRWARLAAQPAAERNECCGPVVPAVHRDGQKHHFTTQASNPLQGQ